MQKSFKIKFKIKIKLKSLKQNKRKTNRKTKSSKTLLYESSTGLKTGEISKRNLKSIQKKNSKTLHSKVNHRLNDFQANKVNLEMNIRININCK